MNDRLADAKRRVVKAKEYAEQFDAWWGEDHKPVMPEDASIQKDFALLVWLTACETTEARLAKEE